MAKVTEEKILNEKTIEENILSSRDYKYGFYTNIESDRIPKGLNEDVIRLIVEKKKEPGWMLEWRLKAYRHWLTMKEPHWPNFNYGPIDYQGVSYYNAPKQNKNNKTDLKEVDPELIKTFERLV